MHAATKSFATTGQHSPLLACAPPYDILLPLFIYFRTAAIVRLIYPTSVTCGGPMKPGSPHSDRKDIPL
jgi:hypothetical protein